MNGVFFPTFKDYHKFLLERWWFRLGVVIYLVGLFVLPFYLFNSSMQPYLFCYDTVIALFDWGTPQYQQQFAHCQEMVRGAIPMAIGIAVAGTLLVHYLFQVIFFKLIVDFIALGRTRR